MNTFELLTTRKCKEDKESSCSCTVTQWMVLLTVLTKVEYLIFF